MIDRPARRSDHARMPKPCRLLLLVLWCLGSLAAQAQGNAAPGTAASAATPAQALVLLDGRLDALKTTLKAKHPDTSLADLRGSALAVQDQARQLALGLAPQMTALQSQLDVLGPAPAKDAPPEAVEVAAQRRQLDKAMATLDAQTKQAQLLGQNALQLATQITGLRNDEFQARLASRTATPLARTFWADPLRTLPDDRVRIKRLGARFADAVAQAWQPPNRQPLVWCLIAAALLLGGGRRIAWNGCC
ncbi:DUF3772 domain-containing protein [Rhodanobacter lindaniclasticus]